MHIKPYNCYTKDTDITYLERANDLAKKPVYEKSIEKPANEEIFAPLDYLKTQRPRQ